MSEESKPTPEELLKNTSQNEAEQNEDDENYDKALKSISPWRIALAVLAGLVVVVYLFVQDFDFAEFLKIKWSSTVIFWLGMALVFVATRHLSYMYRLRVVTDKFFSWKKCFELILVWEFSSAVTPTSVGGSAVALVALSQEKLPPGRTAMIVLYTVILDTFFILMAILAAFLIFGPIMVQPGAFSINYLLTQTVWGFWFFFAFCFMFLYGSLFFYGVFINPKAVQRFLVWLTGFSLLKRFRKAAEKMAKDMDAASQELRQKKANFHLRSFLATAGAWSSKFMILTCLVMGFVAFSSTPEVVAHYNAMMQDSMHYGWGFQGFFIYVRQLAMYIIMAITPTPGGAGAAEFAFKTFHSDYIPKDGTLLLIMTVFWRSLTYYIYLFIGMVIVPNWISKLINRRKKERAEASNTM
jgi:uncharacterized membrane protein YbhN (UPF0104 family)